jgi:MerR family transcriptional regulator/heat shock protein HspR
MADRENEPVYVISVAAKLCEMHPQTLRAYERQGLVRPQRPDSHNRLYSEADIERLRQIQRLTRDLGVNLAGVEVILDLLDRMEAMREEMEQELARLRTEMAR